MRTVFERKLPEPRGSLSDFMSRTWSVQQPFTTSEIPERDNNDSDDRDRNYDNGAATTTKTTITITTINGNESPLDNLPPGADGLATVMDSEIPLASLPMTGGSSGKAPVMLSGLLAAFAASSKSEKREEEAG